MRQILIIITCVLLEIVDISSEYLVQFYDGKDFDGFIHGYNPGPDCVALLRSGQYHASSLKTDVCIMVFENELCEWRQNNSIQIPPGHHPDLSVFHHSNMNFDNKIAAFKLCARDDWGGSDIHDVFIFGLAHPISNICECTTLPEYMFGNINSIHNYGNCLRLFSREGCLGESVDIQGGTSDDSRNLDTVGFKGLTRSLSVCGDSTICTRFNAEIYEIELKSNPLAGYESNVEMASPITYRNNGKSPLTEDYVANKSIKEIIQVRRVKGMTNFWAVSVRETVFIQDVGINPHVLRKEALSEALTEAYSYTTNSSTVKSEVFIKKNAVEFSISEHIQVSPCSQHTVNGYVKVMQNYYVDYVVYTTVTGQKGSRRMTSTELKDELRGMEYVDDYNENAIIAKANGTIIADLGFEAVIEGNEVIIPGCRE